MSKKRDKRTNNFPTYTICGTNLMHHCNSKHFFFKFYLFIYFYLKSREREIVGRVDPIVPVKMTLVKIKKIKIFMPNF